MWSDASCDVTTCHAVATSFSVHLLQNPPGLTHPGIVTQMVDRSQRSTQSIAVGPFTGSFGVGINVSILAQRFIADFRGQAFMYVAAGVTTLLWTPEAALMLLNLRDDGTDASEDAATRPTHCRYIVHAHPDK
jgi:hypothetical protein